MISGVHFNHLRHENSWTSSLTFYSFFCLENASRESVKSPFLVNLVCRSTKFIEPWMTFFSNWDSQKKRRPEKQQTLPGCWFYYLLPTSIMHYTIWPHFFWIHILCSNSLYCIIVNRACLVQSRSQNIMGKVQRADLTCDVTSIKLRWFDPWPISVEYSNFAGACAGHVTHFL